MKIIYFNTKSECGTETVDEISSSDYPTKKAFYKEVARLVNEYHLSGSDVYTSRRCTKEWKTK